MEDLGKHNERARDELLSILEKRSAVLLVGAGCSESLGYPSWRDLPGIMRDKLAPALKSLPADDLVAFFQIKQASWNNGYRNTPYVRFLRDTFAPKTPHCTDLQCQLVKLNFAGIATTNYDVALESAVDRAYADSDAGSHCQPLNVCCRPQDRDSILAYLRRLSSDGQPSNILHLHGVYSEADRLVLSADEYELFYNGIDPDPEMKGLSKHNSRRPLDTFHRRIVWTLLATRPLVFVGFSLADDFFNKVIDVWRSDFHLCLECPHIAFVGVSSDEDRIQKGQLLSALGVSPFFYEVPEINPKDHSALGACISELGATTGVPFIQQNLASITRRTLDLK